MNLTSKIGFLTLFLTFSAIIPAKAQLGQIWGDFYSYTVDLQSYIRNNISETLMPLELRVQGAVQESTGELNLPNPILAGDRVGDDIFFNSLSDKFENNPVVRAQLIQNEIERLITLGSVASDWGQSGQVRLKRKLENTQTSLNNINQYSQEADQIYQNVLNKIASVTSQLTGVNGITTSLNTNQSNLQLLNIKIQSEKAKLSAETLGQTIKTNQFLLYSNLNLSNITQQIEETNRFRRVDASAETARLLKTTAQADLFGRTVEATNGNDNPSNELDSTDVISE